MENLFLYKYLCRFHAILTFFLLCCWFLSPLLGSDFVSVWRLFFFSTPFAGGVGSVVLMLSLWSFTGPRSCCVIWYAFISSSRAFLFSLLCTLLLAFYWRFCLPLNPLRVIDILLRPDSSFCYIFFREEGFLWQEPPARAAFLNLTKSWYLTLFESSSWLYRN